MQDSILCVEGPSLPCAECPLRDVWQLRYQTSAARLSGGLVRAASPLGALSGLSLRALSQPFLFTAPLPPHSHSRTGSRRIAACPASAATVRKRLSLDWPLSRLIKRVGAAATSQWSHRPAPTHAKNLPDCGNISDIRLRVHTCEGCTCAWQLLCAPMTFLG